MIKYSSGKYNSKLRAAVLECLYIINRCCSFMYTCRIHITTREFTRILNPAYRKRFSANFYSLSKEICLTEEFVRTSTATQLIYSILFGYLSIFETRIRRGLEYIRRKNLIPSEFIVNSLKVHFYTHKCVLKMMEYSGLPK